LLFNTRVKNDALWQILLVPEARKKVSPILVDLIFISLTAALGTGMLSLHVMDFPLAVILQYAATRLIAAATVFCHVPELFDHVLRTAV
jgi:hypothetical protein